MDDLRALIEAVDDLEQRQPKHGDTYDPETLHQNRI
jgi:hypothetical protein